MLKDSSLLQEKASSEAFVVSNDPSKMVIAMVAGETSGDTLGANLMIELKARFPKAIFVGIGGPRMQAEGFDSWYPMDWLSVMGFYEVLKSLPKLLKLRKELTGRLLSLKPDVFVGIDAPDFNFTLEKKLKKQGIATVHYVGPSVWAWREKRLTKIKQSVSGVLVLFPFEPEIYQRYNIPVAYVGHPIAANRPEKLDQQSIRNQLGLNSNASHTVVLVGSRKSEFEQLAPIYLKVIKKIQQDYPNMVFLMPVVNQAMKNLLAVLVDQLAPECRIHIYLGQASSCMEAADQALVTSGTASLECAIYELPMVIAIRVHPLSFWIMKRLATTRWVGLPNVLQQQELVKECIQQDANVDNIYQHMLEVIQNQDVRSRQINAFQKQYSQLNSDSARIAADAIQKWALES